MNVSEIKSEFIKLYGGNTDDLRVFASPGRVNLIGEHVDYCGGPVFPAALTMKTTIVARKRNDNIIRLKATDLDIMVETTIPEMVSLKGKLKWGDYQIGVAVELEKAGYEICGCDLLYDDTTPHGGGLSSSAAIEISTALMFATFSNEKKGIAAPVDMIEMAKLGQAAEHNFIGVNCGIMDQFASAMGKANHAIYLDCATLNYEHIPLALGDYCLVLSNTNKKHSLGSSKYNERRSECEEGLNALKAVLLTIEVTVITVIINTIFGLFASWCITRFQFRGKKVISTLIDLPLTISPIIAGLIYVLTFGRQSILYPYKKGKLVALLGPSGSGKTTILRMIATGNS